MYLIDLSPDQIYQCLSQNFLKNFELSLLFSSNGTYTNLKLMFLWHTFAFTSFNFARKSLPGIHQFVLKYKPHKLPSRTVLRYCVMDVSSKVWFKFS